MAFNHLSAIVEFISIPTNIPELNALIQSLSPIPIGMPAYNIRDHVSGSGELPIGYKVDLRGPHVAIDVIGGDSDYTGRVSNVIAQFQIYAVNDLIARKLGATLYDDIEGKSSSKIIGIERQFIEQVINDDQTSYKICLVLYNITTRDTIGKVINQ